MALNRQTSFPMYCSSLFYPDITERKKGGKRKKKKKRALVMGISCMFKELAVFVVKLTIVATSVAAQAKPGCQSNCGDISIPYPFGTGSTDCNISSDFFITCNNTFNPPKAFLPSSRFEVLNISLDGHLRIRKRVGYACYNLSAQVSSSYDALTFLSKFAFSHTRNKFTAIGCDTYAFIQGSVGIIYATVCATVCGGITDVTNGSCFGIGCCQTAIPKGLRGHHVLFKSDDNHSNVWEFNPCSYGFLVEDGAYNFSSLDLNASDFSDKEFPSILDWTIGDQTCQEAKKDPKNYACKENSYCEDAENGPGYLCKCLHGFRGNPYLSDSHGCQDVNECETVNFCIQTCHNLPGSYNCSCRKGFEGDGWKNGTSCSPRPQRFLILIVGCSVSMGTICVLLGTWSIYKVVKRRKNIKLKEKYFKRNGGLLLQQQLSSNEGNVENLRLFASNELEKATDGYNENRILGQGGQGTVYKGMLTDGSIVAIKKYKIMEDKTFDEKKLEQFINEVIILSQINHRNVVKLLGCCLEAEVPLLVYEFIPNGTLSQLLHDQNAEFPITWEMRLRIAIEVANALSYLHSAASAPIYHRDIKSSNIMLDDKYRAKVSDFGTSRSIALEQTHLTTQVQGTFGYLDPEYFRSSQFTEKSDVYSFGVVLVELLTGRKPIFSKQSEEVRSLVTFFLLSIKENSLLDILDPMVLNGAQHEKIVAVAKLAKRCLSLNGKKRPTMKQVAMELEWIRASEEANATQQSDNEDFDTDDEIKPLDIASCSTSRSIVNDILPDLSSDTISLLTTNSTF
ncbi:hypothetical protein DITRI_Ditri05aG0162500 [Diplodiscus trichospermus]